LFCGLGNFTLPLARRAAYVVGVEGDAQLIAGARRNAAANVLQNAQFHVSNLFEPKDFGTWADARYDRILIDPPRAGARELVEQMSRWGARRVVYISCHPGSLARDAGILAQNQGYQLIAAGVMDMFPHTTHIEAIAVFEKSV
jgi:23S rRNA (uracil1939-C5)-methyltransferase